MALDGISKTHFFTLQQGPLKAWKVMDVTASLSYVNTKVSRIKILQKGLRQLDKSQNYLFVGEKDCDLPFDPYEAIVMNLQNTELNPTLEAAFALD